MNTQTGTHVQLSAAAHRSILEDLARRPTIEACGILLGRRDEQGNWYVEQAQALRNVFDSPVYFEFAPEDLLTIELTYPGQTVGVYHSHPTGYARASSTDRENMQRVNKEQEIPWSWLIVCGPFHEQFFAQAAGRLPQDSVIAYYHSPEHGLQQLSLGSLESRQDDM
ncbi:MAG TPA: Mov34/MPN/PAD-1 family protein [Ktedonobacteraceae bacterium]|nr:Mov34/MPN/PAD-1 family protein [Ktedonobacteraceae bacterium]